MTWAIRRTMWGYSLFFDDELVASASPAKASSLVDLAEDLQPPAWLLAAS